MSSEVVIWVDSVSKRYEPAAKSRRSAKPVSAAGKGLVDGQHWTLKDVSFRVYKGETLGIIGRNGAGKTTLLRAISGITQPTSGSVKVSGSIAPVLALQSGFNPQFSGRENVYFKCAVMGLSRKETDERIEQIVDFANIHEFIDRPLKTYSNGMRARLAFAVAFHAEPEILVIDEVLAVGDEPFRRKCIARIASLKEKGTTILFVSHGPALVLQLCDRAILLDNGELLIAGDPKLVISSYQRFIYAPHEERSKVRADLRALGTNGETDPGAAPATAPPTAAEKAPARAASADFDPTVVPESTVPSVPQGARINDATILDQKNRRVNLLAPRREYRLGLRVAFQQPAARARVSMMIKTAEGLEIGGAWSQPDCDSLAFVEQGSRLLISFPFSTHLAPGMYFVDVAVFALIEGKETVLQRIVDATAFQVHPDEERPITGLTDLSVVPVCDVQLQPAQKHAAGTREPAE